MCLVWVYELIFFMGFFEVYVREDNDLIIFINVNVGFYFLFWVCV